MSAKWNEIEIDDFVRRFSMRSKNLMWFLGAGASASAGIPTANDLIWEFKQQLYISQRRVSPHVVSDLSNPSIRVMIQSHIDASGRFPEAGATDEYAALRVFDPAKRSFLAFAEDGRIQMWSLK